MAIYGILGDIHGNREALEAVLVALDARGIGRIACVGDLVGYNADPDACVDILRSRGAIAIAGNHDLIGAGLLGWDRCSNKAMHSLKRTRRSISPRTAEYLRARELAYARLERSGAQFLDVEPAELPIALVNRYLDIKRARLL